MDTRLAERLFVLITSNMDRTYEEECNMAMDVFLEEEFDMGELKRMLLYLLDKVTTKNPVAPLVVILDII